MVDLHVRTVIVGAGAMGCATAYHLARRGEPFLLIEQFAIGHDRGSSHGEARITRHSYADPVYARLMPEAFRQWRDLEAIGGQNLYLRTGGVSLGPPGESYVSRVASCLEAIGCPHRLMTGREWNNVAPMFRVPDDFQAVFEPDAGILLASRAMQLQVDLARSIGGDRSQIWTDHPVLSLDLDAAAPTIVTASHRIKADRLIVTAGPWTGRLFPQFQPHLRVERQQVLYLQLEDDTPYRPGNFPAFIFIRSAEDSAYYGMPVISSQGVKVASHGGDSMDPDDADRTIHADYVKNVRDFLATCLPGLSQAPIRKTEICKYTVAPGDHFLVDFASGRRDVIVASPCSGHGFKFSLLVGRVLADLAMEGESEIDRSPWRSPTLAS